MRIMLVGSQAPGALERYCARGLKQLGHDLLSFDRHAELEAKARFSQTPVLYELEQIPLRRGFNKRLLQSAEQFQPDLVFIVKGIEIYPDTVGQLSTLHSKPILINWNPDSPFDYETANTNKNIIQAIPLYDVYFIWDADLFQPLKEARAKQPEYLPFAYDPEAHAPAVLSDTERAKHACDVCFVGGYTAQRAHFLEALTEFDLQVYGTGWERVAPESPLRKHIINEWRGEGDMAKVLGAATITLNFIREQNGQAHNMRTFEAPAMGAFMLSTKTRDQQKWLPAGVGAAYFADVQSLKAQVAYYIQHAGEAAQIAAEGHRLITTGGHSYTDRMQQVIEVVEAL